MAEKRGGLPEIRFRACVPVEKENPMQSVMLFEVGCIILVGWV